MLCLACVLRGDRPGSVQVWGTFTLPAQVTGSSLIVPRLIKSRGAGTTSFADTLAPKNWLPLPRDLILALTKELELYKRTPALVANDDS
jgi:hypothetical protein